MNKLLVIEHEACTRGLLSSCLQAEGYQIAVAADGWVGIQEAQKQMPDLVICDILMPSMDGYGVLSTFCQSSLMVGTPFIFLAANVMEVELPRQERGAPDSYLAKPATIDNLLEAIAFQLDKQVCKARNPEATLPDSIQDSSPGSESIFPEIDQLSEVFEFIESNYYHPISLNHVAQAVGYSPAYLTNLVGSRSGLTVSRWITERRMVEVRTLLKYSDYSIEKIAAKTGYANVRHLFRQFRQYHNMTPQIWRQKHAHERSSDRCLS
jgi:YesN/AraC family two-component response regulator